VPVRKARFFVKQDFSLLKNLKISAKTPGNQTIRPFVLRFKTDILNDFTSSALKACIFRCIRSLSASLYALFILLYFSQKTSEKISLFYQTRRILRENSRRIFHMYKML